MKSATVLGCLIVSICLVRIIESNIGDFLSNLPKEIGGAFSSVWETIVSAIKRPVRIKRLGHGGKRKTSTSITSTITVTEPTENVKPFSFLKLSNGLQVPVLPTPRWLTVDEWKNLQIPRFVKARSNEKDPNSEIETDDDVDIASTVTDQASLDDEENFGVLFFV